MPALQRGWSSYTFKQKSYTKIIKFTDLHFNIENQDNSVKVCVLIIFIKTLSDIVHLFALL